jgi:prolipoprotein diacylglyceryltransferase/protein-S-isoprenylcysteine O-methyltransferase Ste14
VALSVTGKVFYSLTFVALVPALLIAWAASAQPLIGLPALRSLPLGTTIAAAGLLIMLSGMRDLWVHGGGLPMNAAPPPHYVRRGAYRLFPHPIYTGFSLLCVGVSVAAGSASGLWLVSPSVILGCAALVIGYEHHDLRNRFGPIESALLPPPMDSPRSLVDVVRCWMFVVLPWAILCAAEALPAQNRLWRVDAVAVIAFAASTTLVRTQRELRNAAICGLTAMPVALTLSLLLPGMAGTTGAGQIEPHGFWIFIPSPGAICVFLAAQMFSKRWPSLRWVFAALAIMTVADVIAAKLNGVLPGLAGSLTFVVASQINSLWGALRTSAERLANSWREWRRGPVRMIGHGFYAGLGGALAIGLSGVLAGPRHLPAILVAALSAVIGAALWAQYVEGSAQLLRPYGFYGGLLGGTLGAMAAPLFHSSPWMVLAAFSVTGPWAQALGRLRCLVQGCCHGSPASDTVGIRYVHPRSRVCRLTEWTGVPLHPTPLYSFLWNAWVGLLLVRIWTQQASLSLIIGLYFILSGIGRFAEEGWRGEPQTQVVAGLRLYQWAAVASILLGGIFTAIADRAPTPSPEFRWSVLLAATVFGLFVSCAMGLDFPESNRRFSRLT